MNASASNFMKNRTKDSSHSPFTRLGQNIAGKAQVQMAQMMERPITPNRLEKTNKPANEKTPTRVRDKSGNAGLP